MVDSFGQLNMVTWKRTKAAEPGSLGTTIYDSNDGRWSLRKEFFAAGPTLFTWRLYESGSFVAEFATKRAATTFICDKDGQS